MLSRAPITANSVRHDVAERVEGDKLVPNFLQFSLPLTALRRINIYLLTCPDVSKVNWKDYPLPLLDMDFWDCSMKEGRGQKMAAF